MTQGWENNANTHVVSLFHLLRLLSPFFEFQTSLSLDPPKPTNYSTLRRGHNGVTNCTVLHHLLLHSLHYINNTYLHQRHCHLLRYKATTLAQAPLPTVNQHIDAVAIPLFGIHNSQFAMPMRFLFSCFFLFTTLIARNTVYGVSNAEVSVLISWVEKRSDLLSTVFNDWKIDDSSPCKWGFVECDVTGFVTKIEIRFVELNLPFPVGFSSLLNLRSLVLSGCNLTGNVPDSVGEFAALQVFDISSNSIEGSIPATIGKLKNLQVLDFSSNQLTGRIPAEIGDCLSLKTLAVFDNFLIGELPVEIGKLSNLQVLRAGGNTDISGGIPAEIGECRNLQVLGLSVTKLSGAIPASIGNLIKLQTLSIYTAKLSGEIPPEIGNCSELVELFLYQNSLSGSIPSQLGNLKKLEKLLLWQNNLVGIIPEEIGGCTSLRTIDLSLNSISGGIPLSFGNLLNLEELMLSSNNVSGSIPIVLANATNLVQLQLDTNQISGSIPPELGMLKGLTVFFAWNNNLVGNIPSTLSGCKSLQALDLSHNSLTGSLPSGIFHLQNLTKLLLISNEISGTIPPEIGSCGSLTRLRLVGNKINGEIPKEIGFLDKLVFLDLSENRLTGPVPDEIGNCTALQMLNLRSNTLGGALPDSLSVLRKLQVLDVSSNHLTGQVPSGLGNLRLINRLDLSKNLLSGPIPSTLGTCTSLELIDLSKNNLSGSIPTELFELEGLDIALNLSWNELTGTMSPQVVHLSKLSVLDVSHNRLGGDLMAFSQLSNLVSLNVSYNNFTGYLPDTKLFRQLFAEELEGNKGLCSSTSGDSCFTRAGSEMDVENHRWSKRFKVAMSLLVSLTALMAIVGLFMALRARKVSAKDDDSESERGSFPWQLTPFQKISFSAEHVLKCLVESNVIGKGCSGVVYRADLGNGQVIAVKKLWPSTMASNYSYQEKNSSVRDSFSAELKTLGSIRHKNIVKFLGCCWNKNTRLLMYEYMPNGSLGRILHERDNSSNGCLEWDLRYQIILGAAQGLSYLHHDCVPPIVHRDIKANNILIGLQFEPYIADFGLAKMVNDGDFAKSSNTVAGSYGYIAPEYGYSMKITKKSDVYSYGVVVLEVLTGKQPIDPTIPDGLHIVDWVRQKQWRCNTEVLDEILQARPESEIDEMMQTLGVAILCVNPSPDDRPTMKDVAAMLKEIREDKVEDQCCKVDARLESLSDGYSKSSSSNGGPSRPHEQQQRENASFSGSSLVYSS
uniref:LRR receptor-like serine/threonine-protein kinase RCH1 n=1 Tax=Sedum alfredii TaxID=439688 RepID=A0A410N670_9MAGN|nr:LRR receptor-like serine/threonine-protein kinase RCH1 [Sedum alfredii]